MAEQDKVNPTFPRVLEYSRGEVRRPNLALANLMAVSGMLLIVIAPLPTFMCLGGCVDAINRNDWPMAIMTGPIALVGIALIWLAVWMLRNVYRVANGTSSRTKP
jgi:hypothetical protein